MENFHIRQRSFSVVPRKYTSVVQNMTSSHFQVKSMMRSSVNTLITKYKNDHPRDNLSTHYHHTEATCQNDRWSNRGVNLPKSTPSARPVSLRNVGANCYLNSALQAISSCTKFVQCIVKLHIENIDLIKLRTFAILIEELNKGCSSMEEMSTVGIFKEWKKTGQQDSYELLAHVLNEVYNELREYKEERGEVKRRNITEWLQVPLPIRILMLYEITCDCHKVSFSPLQSDLAFHVTIDRSKNGKCLQMLLDNFFDDEIIEDYVCDDEECTARKAKRKIWLYLPLPDTLCIHLQRTFWDVTKMQKIRDRVDFGQHLLIKKEYWKDDGLVTDVGYSLRSVIVHQGDVYGGHYVCYKRVDRIWYYTSDFVIRQVDWAEVAACQGYVFFYEIGTEDT